MKRGTFTMGQFARRPLTSVMVQALAQVGHAWQPYPHGVRLGTLDALVARRLIETRHYTFTMNVDGKPRECSRWEWRRLES